MLKQTISSEVSVILRGNRSTFLAYILEEVQIRMREHGESINVQFIGETDDEVETAILLGQNIKPKGIIFVGGSSYHFRKEFSQIPVPCTLITVDGEKLGFDNLSSFTTDDEEAAGYAVSKLIAKGHRRIGVLAGGYSEENDENDYNTLRVRGIVKELEKNGRIVIPGFYGRSPTGKIKVMSRGGSDISGALAAAAVDADVYENWTDVSGILMADPKIVADPKPIAKITFAELRELAYMGASVLHEDSILPVKEKGIPLNIRNTNCPEDPGTVIVENAGEEAEQDRPITGIAGRRNFTVLTIRKRGMTSSFDLREVLEITDRYHAAVEHITLGLDSFALVIASSALESCLYDLIADIQKECAPDEVNVQDGIALVAAVGRKMSSRPGTSGRLFQALGQEGLNIRTIAQGADELSIIVGVDNSDFEKTIRVLYDGFTG